MTKTTNLLGVLLFTHLLLSSCAIFQPNKENKRRLAAEAVRPSWVLSTVGLNGNYYWGTASAPILKGVTLTKSQTDQVKQRALTEIASQISVKVASQTVLSNTSASETTKSVLRQNMQQTIRLSAEQYLDGVEFVEKYSDEFGYFELYRLSIANQQAMRRSRIEAARNEAMALLEKAKEYQTNNNYRLAISNTLKVLHGLSEYANDDLSTSWNGRSINPLVEADKLLPELIEQMTISPLQPYLTARPGETIDASLFGFRLTTPSGNPISGAKLTFKSEGFTFHLPAAITNANGTWSENFRLNSYPSSSISLAASVDLHSIISSSGVSNAIAQLALAHPSPTALITINTLSPQIHIEATDNTLSSRLIKTTIEKEFIARDFELAADAPSLSIITSLRPERCPSYITLTLDVSLSWIDAQGYTKNTKTSFNESGTSEQAALEKLINAFEKELHNRLVQQIIKSIY